SLAKSATMLLLIDSNSGEGDPFTRMPILFGDGWAEAPPIAHAIAIESAAPRLSRFNSHLSIGPDGRCKHAECRACISVTPEPALFVAKDLAERQKLQELPSSRPTP